MTTGVLLGPQRHAITVTDEIIALGITGRIAVVTAGWQEREAEDDELQVALGHRAVNLRLHKRVDDVFARDSELFDAHRARQDKLRQLQELYRIRLDHTLAAARALYASQAPAELLEPERAAAIASLQALDAHHLARIRALHDAFEAAVRPAERPVLREHRQEIHALIHGCEAVAIAGGHVSTLLNRMRLLDVLGDLGARPIIAWSAGAMVVSDRVVLFHDRPPEGPGNAEILDEGLGLFPNVVALPHATQRLQMDDRPRMAMFALRFSPALCVALDPRCRASYDGERWTAAVGTQYIAPDGSLVAMQPRPVRPPSDIAAPPQPF